MELQIDGQLYQIAKMDAFSQLHVARKLGGAIPLIDGLVSEHNQGKDMSLLMVLLMSKMTDEEADFITRKCLSVVSRKQPQGWVALQANGTIMFADVSVGALINLTASVIVENLGDFFRTALANLEGQMEEQ